MQVPLEKLYPGEHSQRALMDGGGSSMHIALAKQRAVKQALRSQDETCTEMLGRTSTQRGIECSVPGITLAREANGGSHTL
jgi:hypothetical protein